MVVATETLDKRRSSPPGESRLDAEASSESTLCLSGRGGAGREHLSAQPLGVLITLHCSGSEHPEGPTPRLARVEGKTARPISKPGWSFTPQQRHGPGPAPSPTAAGCGAGKTATQRTLSRVRSLGPGKGRGGGKANNLSGSRAGAWHPGVLRIPGTAKLPVPASTPFSRVLLGPWAIATRYSRASC